MFGFLTDPDSVKAAAEANKGTGKQDGEGAAAQGNQQHGDAATSPLALPSLDGLWSVAKAVRSAVQSTAGEVVRSVQDTDWRSELTAFTHEVEAEAARAVEVVQHLPEKLPPLHHHLPRGSGSGEAGASPRSSADAAAGSSAPPTAASSSSRPHAGIVGGRVGSSLAQFGQQLISGTKEVFETVTDMVESELATATREVPRFAGGGGAGGARSRGSASGGSSQRALAAAAAARYSRFEAEVAAMQRDSATYCDEPEDAADFGAWQAGSFSIDAAQPEIDRILAGNAFMTELHSRLVPLLVEKEVFWGRYFYCLHKLQQREEQRQQLAARAKQLEQDQGEELGGWDDDESPHAVQQQPGEQQQQHVEDAQPEEQRHAVEAAAPPVAAPAAAAADDDGGSEQQSVPAAAAPEPGSSHGGTASGAAAAASGAAAVAAAASGLQAVALEDSFPSTPVQVGSDASDAAPATDTISDTSTAAAPWTAVAKQPQPQQQQQSPPPPPQQQQQSPAATSPPPPPQAAPTSPSKAPLAPAAAAPPAAPPAAADDDDDDWGDDADAVAAPAAGGRGGAGGSKAAAAAGKDDDDDDWSNWE